MSVEQNSQPQVSEDVAPQQNETSQAIQPGPSNITPNVVWSAKLDATQNKRYFQTGFAFPMPTAYWSDHVRLVDKDKVDQVSITETGRVWANTAVAATRFGATYRDQFSKTVDRDGQFSNEIQTQKGVIRPERKIIRVGQSQSLPNSVFIAVARQTATGSSPYSVPLWSSGITLRLDPVAESTLFAFNRAIAQEKYRLGRSKYGSVYSGTRGIALLHLIRNVLRPMIANNKHSVDLTVKDGDPVDVLSLIKITDLNPLLAAMADCQWPSGFPYARACLSESCTDVVHEQASPSKMIWSHEDSLNPSARAHMANNTASAVSVKQVTEYQSTLLRNQSSEWSYTFPSGNIHTYVFRVCTIPEYLDSAVRWTAPLEKQISDTDGEDAQNDALDLLGKSSALHMYAHFVESLSLKTPQPDSVVLATVNHSDAGGIETIETTLQDLSPDSDFRIAFVEAVNQFIDDATITVFAAPNYKCPACGKLQLASSASQRFPSLIPVDPLSTFFVLSEQLELAAQNRP